MILVVYAHPHHARSVTNRALIDAVRDLDGVRVNPLYERYPDFSIDGDVERELLIEADLVVWQHPLYWYAPPALMKLWFEEVLRHGWAFGEGGRRLAGKHCQWVVTTGAPENGYRSDGIHAHDFGAFAPVVRQTAKFCGMHWLEPIVVHGASRIEPDALEREAERYRNRLARWQERRG